MCYWAFWVSLDFWVEARTALEKTKTIFWLAESDPIEHPDYFQAFDACYAWTWMHKTEDFYKNNHDKKMLDALLYQYNATGNGDDMKLWFTSNHDENSWNGTEYEKYGDAAKAFAVHSITWNGIPLIYSGQELPNVKRLEFFEKDVIAWNGKYELQDFYTTLLTLKKNNPALRGGDAAVYTYMLRTSADYQVMAYLRKNAEQEVLVVINFSREKINCVIDDANLAGRFTNIFSKTTADFTIEKTVDLGPWGYFVFEK
jgi:alpha-amylase